MQELQDIDYNNNNLSMALRYAKEFNWPVFPMHNPVGNGCSCGKAECSKIGKHPRIKDWVNIASTDEHQIWGWWTMWPDANIGIPTGSDTFYVLDVDISDGKPGQTTLNQLIAEHEELPETLSATTGSGGKHYCFWINTEEEIGNKVGFRDGLDFRGDGGCIVVEPSLHKSGNQYEWDNLEVYAMYEQVELHEYAAEMPSWLLDIISEDKTSKPKTNTQPDIHNIAAAPIRDGVRRSTLFKLGCSFREIHGFDASLMSDVLSVVNEKQPEPLEQSEIDEISADICNRYAAGKDKSKVPEVDLSSYLEELFEGYKQVGRNELLGLKLNKFKQLASAIRGIQNGFYLIPGESGAGKTMFLINLFWDLIESNEVMGFYISLDDPTKTIINRSLACLSGVAINDIQQLKGCDAEIKQASLAVNKIQNYIKQGRVNIYDISQIDHINKLMTLAAGIDKKFFICVDGMYNLGVGKYANARDENIKRANELKKLADIHHIPVICTGEVRKGDGKSKRKLGNDDIMETSKLIYNPNLILILTKIMLGEVFTGQLKLYCSKNKLSGFDGDIILNIDKDKCQVTEQQQLK